MSYCKTDNRTINACIILLSSSIRTYVLVCIYFHICMNEDENWMIQVFVIVIDWINKSKGINLYTTIDMKLYKENKRQSVRTYIDYVQ